ncbi:MAG: 1-acyl-sn-glycerol-3-phosphate acyltransferase [Acidobacteria bacterium]|nr:1-acyl-sn-glycerol-3-phosphate acyltransferase [Acidobacteriota bacterium]
MLRSIWTASVTLFATVICATPIIVFGMFGRTNTPTIDRLVRLWAKMILFAAGVTVTAKTDPSVDPETKYVFIANHQSYLDIPVLFVAVRQPIRVMAKRSLFQIPIFGWGLKAAGFIPIDRKDRSTALASFRLAGDRIRMGNSVLVFPEGSRSRSTELGAFQRGAFLLAMRARLDIVPVGIIGTRDVMPVGKLIIRSGPVTIRIAAPIPVADYPAPRRDELTERTRAEIEALLREAHAE